MIFCFTALVFWVNPSSGRRMDLRHWQHLGACCCVVAKSCLTLCEPRGCSLSGSSVYGISQAIILEWVANYFSRESS